MSSHPGAGLKQVSHSGGVRIESQNLVAESIMRPECPAKWTGFVRQPNYLCVSDAHMMCKMDRMRKAKDVCRSLENTNISGVSRGGMGHEGGERSGQKRFSEFQENVMSH